MIILLDTLSEINQLILSILTNMSSLSERRRSNLSKMNSTLYNLLVALIDEMMSNISFKLTPLYYFPLYD